MAWLAGLSGVNEQIFGADEQAPKGAVGVVQKMHSGRENSVRAMLVATAAEDRLNISPTIDVMPCRKFVSGTLTIGASVQRKLARLPIR